MSSFGNLIRNCENVREEKTVFENNGRTYERVDHYLDGDKIILPENVFIEATRTSIKGTVGRLVDVEVDTWDDGRLSTWSGVYIIEVDGRPKPSRIHSYHAAIIDNPTGFTKWVYGVQKKEKDNIPAHVNKYGQTISNGDWVIGLGNKKKIYFGKVIRYTKTTISTTLDLESKNPKCQKKVI